MNNNINNMKKRYGFIKVSTTLFEGDDYFKLFPQIVKDVRIFRIEKEFYHYVLYCESELFDEVEEAEKVPQYECTITKIGTTDMFVVKMTKLFNQ